MEGKNHVSKSPLRGSPSPRLSESRGAKARLDALLLGCFTVQKLYGRDAGSMETVSHVFHAALAKYPADVAIRAFETWIERNQEFPTPADIAGLIRRNGRAPVSEAQFVAISRKDGADRTPEDWQALRDYDAERQGGWGDDAPDPRKQAAALEDNARLRQEVARLREECSRLAGLLRAAPAAPPTPPSAEEKARRTIEDMRRRGVPEADVREAAESLGVAV